APLIKESQSRDVLKELPVESSPSWRPIQSPRNSEHVAIVGITTTTLIGWLGVVAVVCKSSTRPGSTPKNVQGDASGPLNVAQLLEGLPGSLFEWNKLVVGSNKREVVHQRGRKPSSVDL